jgi:DNA invertase Pin-like site-specific DNA recombinase
LDIIYIRQSTERQVLEHTGSTDFQRNLTAIARSYGWLDSQIQIIDEDLGITGSSSEGRTGWQRMQTMTAAGQVGVVFCVTISRLSRDLLDFEIFRRIAAGNNALIYTEGRFVDPADSNDIIFSQLTAMLASHENRQRTRLMSQARITKAKKGEMVSVLPVGWIKGADGRYDFDPETKDTIQLVIDTFRQTRSVYRTVRALIKAGVQLPSSQGRRLFFTRPNAGRVIRILKNPAYAGIYVYGKTQCQPGGPVLASGQSKRMKAPEDRWTKIYNNHPAYISVEEQEEFKSILKNNGFGYRHRAGHGRALTQGLLRCAVCKRSLNVAYHRESYSYVCRWDQPCTQFTNGEFDKHILAELFRCSRLRRLRC